MPDEQAFREFAAARGPALLRTAYLLTADPHQAEDLLQTTLAKVYVAWNRLRDPAAAEAYARRTMVRSHASWWRRRSAHERPTGDADHDTPARGADAFDAVVERDLMWSTLSRLPRQQQVVVALRFYEDLSVAEVARLMGVSVGAVKTHTSRALASLRVSLAEPTTADATKAVQGK
jgi:RNA polymerase sigma-70 factor (sigma-E family)